MYLVGYKMREKIEKRRISLYKYMFVHFLTFGSRFMSYIFENIIQP